jgi:hypothetical protein
MKILYITPTIHDAGGVERVLAVKTNYLIEQYGYSICFLTLNNTVKDPFFKFNLAISGGLFFWMEVISVSFLCQDQATDRFRNTQFNSVFRIFKTRVP